MPRVAVIIPAFNHGHYLAETLGSVLAQTRPADRILVLDDGSSDDSAEVCRGFPEVEVEVQENAGAHVTLNRLVRKAASDCDLIAILNSDDQYHPERLARCLSAFDEHPGTAVVATGIELIDDDGAALPEDHPRSKWFRAAWSIGDRENISLAEWVGAANFLATTSNVVADARYLADHPFRPYRFNHDYRLLAEAAVQGVLHVLSEPLVSYRIHATNTITTAPAPLIREMVRMHLELYRDLGGRELGSDEARRFGEFARASWDNISSLSPAHLQTSLAALLAGASNDQITEVVESLPEDELAHFPNRALVNAHEGKSPLSADSGLAAKYEELRQKAGSGQDKAKAASELASLRAQLLASRWVALGRVLGPGKALTKNDGKDPAEKLEKLRGAVGSSSWLKLGRALGSKTGRALTEAGSEE